MGGGWTNIPPLYDYYKDPLCMDLLAFATYNQGRLCGEMVYYHRNFKHLHFHITTSLTLTSTSERPLFHTINATRTCRISAKTGQGNRFSADKTMAILFYFYTL